MHFLYGSELLTNRLNISEWVNDGSKREGERDRWRESEGQKEWKDGMSLRKRPYAMNNNSYSHFTADTRGTGALSQIPVAHQLDNMNELHGNQTQFLKSIVENGCDDGT